MHATSLTSKGQVTIPIEYRDALGLHAGDKIGFEQKGNTLVLRRQQNDIKASFGILKAKKGVSLAQMKRTVMASAGR
jgi:AbrB family looped-hinge helix DNA binding protein